MLFHRVITDEDYFDYKVEMLKYIEKYSDALEVIISDKDCENKAMLVNDILNRSPDLRKKVDDYRSIWSTVIQLIIGNRFCYSILNYF